MLSYVVLFTLCGAALAATSQDSNIYIDTVLTNVYPNEARSSNLVPLKFPDFQTEFKDKVAFVSVKVKNSFKQGTLDGLLSISRARDCSAPFNKFGNIVVNCTLSLDGLYLEYKVDIKYGKLPTVEAKVKTVIDRTLIAVEITSSRAANRPTFSSFQITSLGERHNTFTGLGPINKQLKALESGYNENVSKNLDVLLRYDFQRALSNAIARNPLPLP